MERKKEQLDIELVNELKKLRDDLNKLTIIIGQEEIKKRKIEEQLSSFESSLDEYYNLQKKYDTQLNSRLSQLEKVYKNGEVDVDEGVIFYEEKLDIDEKN